MAESRKSPKITPLRHPEINPWDRSSDGILPGLGKPILKIALNSGCNGAWLPPTFLKVLLWEGNTVPHPESMSPCRFSDWKRRLHRQQIAVPIVLSIQPINSAYQFSRPRLIQCFDSVF